MASDALRTVLAVDIGGSFTDVVLERAGVRHTAKALTTPREPEHGVLAGIEEVLRASAQALADVSLVILGTTLATNALIERKGARTALLATEGFRDVLEIGHENRYAQYDLAQAKPEPLVPRQRRFGVPERIDARGRVIVPLDEAALAPIAAELRRLRVESVAVAYLHSYANPAHERRTRELLQRSLPGVWITLSSDVCPEVREYERTSTACANAYVQPAVAGSLERLKARLQALGFKGALYLITSSGALTSAEQGAEQPIRLVESGPAGGAILAASVAEECDEARVLSFDMGGTTAKITFIDDFEPQHSRSFEFGRVYRFLKGSGLPVRIPVIEMVEIGAGGGSIAGLDAMGRLQVGPESAVSDPGPACFGRGGVHPTVTDADCATGHLDARRFASGKVTLAPEQARVAIERAVAGPLGLAVDAGAAAVQQIVVENMANAARVHAAELGKAVEDYTLVAFGGAAPLHAAALAARLGLRRLIVPEAASVGSALGFLRAPVAWQLPRSLHQRLDAFDEAAVGDLLAAMHHEAAAAVRRAARADAVLTTRRQAFMRYVGQGHEIAVDLPAAADAPVVSAADLKRRFEGAYERLYGRTIPHLAIEVMSWSVSVSTAAPPVRRVAAAGPRHVPPARGVREVFDAEAGRWLAAAVHDREALAAGATVDGPALVCEDQTTTVVPAGATLRMHPLGHLLIERAAAGLRAGAGPACGAAR